MCNVSHCASLCRGGAGGAGGGDADGVGDVRDTHGSAVRELARRADAQRAAYARSLICRLGVANGGDD